MNTQSMALRVLLADESSTIKKVMLLALQDFGVEVKSVPVGVDVLTVAKSFRPDIVFADVLLAKKSGYDVCAELKSDPQFTNIPVILMWSGFMDFDSARALEVGADEKLEKPFDAEGLRSIVRSFVPKTQTNEISNFLSFPDMPDWVDDQPSQQTAKITPPTTGKPGTIPPPPSALGANKPGMKITPKVPPAAPSIPIPPAASPKPVAIPSIPVEPPLSIMAQPPPPPAPPPVAPTFPMVEEVEEADEFQAVPLPKNRTNQGPELDQEIWSHQNLQQFNEPGLSDSFEQSIQNPLEEPVELTPTDFEEVQFPLHQPEAVSPQTTSFSSRQFNQEIDPMPAAPSAPVSHALPVIDPERAEQILREQVREVLTDIAWKILPDITERIVREELQKLMKDAEKLS